MTQPDQHIKIIPFRKELAPKFAALNYAWLEKYFAIEPLDQRMLENPTRYFIEPGGHIFFATFDDEIAGTFALLKTLDSEFELAKMAVAENFQGLKIGNRMLEFAIAKAKELKLKKLILYSSTKLLPALHLYRKYGFVEVPVGHSEYLRSDIKMELVIEQI
ncbi:MAG: GNAT family N-acetyltransferase [Bacteroidota bacterium]|nr:GNAT family N-acetyltransferase [Ferruginibacter sp.]